jgi:methyltransferase (TIGR00027 family)
MKRNQASTTAAWVAAARSAGALLPPHLQLVRDPYGVRFADGVGGRLTRWSLRRPRLGRALLARRGPLGAFVLWMQLRTRALDDMLREFVLAGGRQIVLLGAGYDCRAVRFSDLLGTSRIYEVDHPQTQAVKRARVPRLPEARVAYVSWDFARGLVGLPPALVEAGLDASLPTLTVWEGVTMYLEPPQIEETLRCVRALGAPGSGLAFTYLDRDAVERPRGDGKLTARLVAGVGEPYRFGWAPALLSDWLFERGYALCSDHTEHALAARHWPAEVAARFAAAERHVALARTLPTPGTSS